MFIKNYQSDYTRLRIKKSYIHISTNLPINNQKIIELEMITADQLKEIQERKDALRRYL